MNYDAVITQLKQHALIFAGNVAGAADYERAIQDQVWLPLPAAYVRPLDEDAEPNTLLNALNQLVTERVAVTVIFDNSADRRGQSVTKLYEPTRQAIFAALLNWRLDPLRAARGLEYQAGRLIAQDRAQLFYQWEFGQQITLTDRDGWQEPAEPLRVIDQQFERPDGTALGAAFIALPQP